MFCFAKFGSAFKKTDAANPSLGNGTVRPFLEGLLLVGMLMCQVRKACIRCLNNLITVLLMIVSPKQHV